jgi:hypothetical protein
MPTMLEPEPHTEGDRSYRLTTLTACSVERHRSKSPRHEQAEWPAEADFILSALDTARAAGRPERRAGGRVVLRTLAALELYSDRPGDAPWVLCTRDATTRGLGFISRSRVPLGHGGTIQIRGPHDEALTIACTVRRCHETVNGWFEGSISFNREQWSFDPSHTRDAD